MIAGHLKFIVLKALSERKESGYSLIKHIEKSTGCYKPSTGSIYPMLEEFRNEGCVTAEKKGRKTMYTLTSKGRCAFGELSAKRIDFIKCLEDNIKVFASVYDTQGMEIYAALLERLKAGEAPLRDVSPELNQFRTLILDLCLQGKIPENKARIRRILKKSIDDLRGLT